VARLAPSRHTANRSLARQEPAIPTGKKSTRKPRPAAATAASHKLRQPGKRRAAEAALQELKARLLEIEDIGAAAGVLGWDQATYMPAEGAGARARQIATLTRLAHQRAIDPALGRLLDELQGYAAGLPPDSDAACLIRLARRGFEKAIKVPADFVARWSAFGARSYDAWTRARPADDFATMRPLLQQALDFSRAYAELFAPFDRIADPLIDDLDEGMTTASVLTLFTQLRAALVPMVRAIAERPAVDDGCLHGAFAEAKQIAFGLGVAKRFGYDLRRGRLDQTHHPFCSKFAAGDVRITTRVRPDNLADCLFSTLHECGHALYEQGVDAALEGTPLGWGASAGIHESQSRLWENIVGRGRDCWRHFYPGLCEAFPDPFQRVPLDTFYAAINKVERSLIRTDADEVTYNLHVMMRFDLELELLEGRLQVHELPEAWRARFAADFGIVPHNDRDGCLQDVHWYCGRVGGGFQGYAIGNILAAQFYAAALAADPNIPCEIAKGNFAPLAGWLREHIYRHGAKFKPDELLLRATGSRLSIAPYTAYLRGKFGPLYRL
jgi:carboxypeptidase Taq